MKKQKISLQLRKQKISSLASNNISGGDMRTFTVHPERCMLTITEMTRCLQNTCNDCAITIQTIKVTDICDYFSKNRACQPF